MQIQKEDANGELYQMSLFSAGILFGQSPRQREGRHKITSEGKRKINAMARKWELMQRVNANFTAGRDIFACLTYREVPKNAGRCLSEFHKKAKPRLAAMGAEHTYIAVTETHDMDGEEVRIHHHLIMRGASGAGRWKEIARALEDCWPHGHLDARVLRRNADFFGDTVEYLLKEDKPARARHYSCSRNLHPPNEPVRLRVPEAVAGEVPPGVKVVEHIVRANEFGRYEYIVGKIYDARAFAAYWKRQQKRAAPDPWARLANRRRRLGQDCRRQP